nr:epidermal growth factor-like protein 7 isoform X3 [Chrysemys picta bellii]
MQRGYTPLAAPSRRQHMGAGAPACAQLLWGRRAPGRSPSLQIRLPRTGRKTPLTAGSSRNMLSEYDISATQHPTAAASGILMSPAVRRKNCSAGCALQRCRTEPLPMWSPTCSLSTSPTSQRARDTGSAVRTEPHTRLPIAWPTGDFPSPSICAAPDGDGQTSTQSDAAKPFAGCLVKTVGAVQPQTDAPALQDGWGNPARQMWMNALARVTAAASIVSTRLGATAVPVGLGKGSPPMGNHARLRSHPLRQRPPPPSTDQKLQLLLAPFHNLMPSAADDVSTDPISQLFYSLRQLDRIESLSEQISFLEERLETCSCKNER